MLKRIFRWLKFNSRYLGQPAWDSGITPPEVMDFIQRTPPGRALDLGAGTGTNMVTLAKAGWDVTGVEFALIAVMSARRKIRKEKVTARVFFQDITEIEYIDPPLDLILDIGCFHSLDSFGRERYRENILRLLKPGGTFLLYSFLRTHNGEVTGITQQEIDLFSEVLNKKSAVYGTERGIRQSVWLEFQR